MVGFYLRWLLLEESNVDSILIPIAEVSAP